MKGCKERQEASSPAQRKAARRKRYHLGGKPSPEVTIREDGSEVLEGMAKFHRWLEVWELDKRHCVKCGLPVMRPYTNAPSSAEIHHVNSRGMFGFKRDDRREVDGKLNLVTLCKPCHREVTP